MVTAVFVLAACSDWLDVRPKTEMKSDRLFATEEGFVSALTGIYSLMESNGLYGQQLTFDFMEKLVMRYDNYDNNPSKKELAKIYDYKNQETPRNTLGSIWSNMYNAIANVNNLLHHLEVNGDRLHTPGYDAIIRGEALGLRAFLYFDLLRMWGPVYQKDSTASAIPYRTEFTNEKIPLSPANVVMERIMEDLSAAEKLLQDTDPLVFGMNTKDSFLGYRKNRMNILAVKALIARAALWRGDKGMAAEYAEEVIRNSGLTLNIENMKDVAMYNETLFALDIFKMEDKLSTYFPSTTFTWNVSQLWISTSNLDEVYETGTIGINDIRGKQENGFAYGDGKRLLRKFMPSADNSYSNHMPLIRLSEMYYILAEATELKKAASYINTVRNARGIGMAYDIDPGTLSESRRIEELQKEYEKDYFGEGQFFYFLKRNNRGSFRRSVVAEMYNYYVFPLPDAEVEYGLTAEE